MPRASFPLFQIIVGGVLCKDGTHTLFAQQNDRKLSFCASLETAKRAKTAEDPMDPRNFVVVPSPITPPFLFSASSKLF
jgi:hypothetical protein